MNEATEVELHQLRINVHKNTLELDDLSLFFKMQTWDECGAEHPEVKVFAARQITLFYTFVVRLGGLDVKCRS